MSSGKYVMYILKGKKNRQCKFDEAEINRKIETSGTNDTFGRDKTTALQE